MNKIFEYELADAWGTTISKITVTDDNKNNVICIFPCISPFVKGLKPDVKSLTANPSILNKIWVTKVFRGYAKFLGEYLGDSKKIRLVP